MKCTQASISVNSQFLVNVENSPTMAASYPRMPVRQLAGSRRLVQLLVEEVWNRRGIKLLLKLKIDKAVVAPTLLYGSETFTSLLACQQAEPLLHWILNKLLSFTWQVNISDTDIHQSRPSQYSLQSHKVSAAVD